MWNGKKVPRIDLGRFATQQEAHNKFLIAAFYYNRGAGLLDGWFQVPPMSEEERSLTGEEKRKWVIGQTKKVYADFKKKKAEAALLLSELFEVSEVQATPGHDEGLALSNGHSLGFQEGSALPVSQLPPNTESGMSLNGSDQLNLLQIRVGTQQQQISLQQQQISDQQQQIQEFAAQILQLQHQQRIQQQQLQESRIQNPQWPCQFCLQQQQLEDVNQGVPSFEGEMEQSLYQQHYPDFMAPPPDGGEVQEAFFEMDTLL